MQVVVLIRVFVRFIKTDKIGHTHTLKLNANGRDNKMAITEQKSQL